MQMRAKLCCIAVVAAIALLGGSRGDAATIFGYSDLNVTDFNLTSAIANNLTIKRTSFIETTSVRLASQEFLSNKEGKLACQGDCKNLKENEFAVHPPHLAQADLLVAEDLKGARSDALVNLSRAEIDRIDSLFGSYALNALDLFINFSLAQADTVTLSFKADPEMKVEVSADAPKRSMAESGAHVTCLISNSSGEHVFLWIPTGTPGFVPGVTVISDPFSLFKILRLDKPGKDGFDPAAGVFSAASRKLDPGNYSLDLMLVISARGIFVPEPSSLALMSISALLAWVWKRNRVR